MNIYRLLNKLLPRWALLLTIALFVGCSGTPKKSVYAPPALPHVIQYALSLEGVPYRWGKATPKEGFDCSGFIQHVYKHEGVYLPRTVKEMASTLPQIPKNQLHSGDLVFFNTNGKRYSHVGLYVDNHKFIHAPSRRSGKVKLSSLKQRYWRNRFSGARRPR